MMNTPCSVFTVATEITSTLDKSHNRINELNFQNGTNVIILTKINLCILLQIVL